MNKMLTQWTKQLDDFDGALKPLPGIADNVRMWGVFAPAVPALYEAMLRELDSYQVTAGELRAFIAAHDHDKEAGNPVELGQRLRSTIEASRRLKSVIDAYNREKAVAEQAFPELAGGSLKDTAVVMNVAPMNPPGDARKDASSSDAKPADAKAEDAPRQEQGGNGQAPRTTTPMANAPHAPR